MTESELGTPLGPGEPKKQEELKFTDYSINKFQSDFSSGRKKIRTKIENSGLKGLKISQSKTTKKKYFVQNFCFNNKPDYCTVGEFRSDVYGVNECRKDVNEIMDDHTNSGGLWIKNLGLKFDEL